LRRSATQAISANATARAKSPSAEVCPFASPKIASKQQITAVVAAGIPPRVPKRVAYASRRFRIQRINATIRITTITAIPI
jgi:hypothetical protein